MAARGTVNPEEAAAWIVLDDLPVHWRGTTTITTRTAIELFMFERYAPSSL
jgi:hypothetical protein